METNLFNLAHDISASALKEAIYARLVKTKSIISYVLLARDNEDANRQVLHGALWAIDDYVDELQIFCERLTELVN
jgi:hypothetical protein